MPRELAERAANLIVSGIVECQPRVKELVGNVLCQQFDFHPIVYVPAFSSQTRNFFHAGQYLMRSPCNCRRRRAFARSVWPSGM